MTAFLALFRGINVGGHQKVLMADLKALHEELGLEKVVTYIQSGNVLFTSEDADPDQLTARIADGFAQRFGFRVAVTVRSAAQLDSIIEHNPFQEQSVQEPRWLLVLFLTAHPAPGALEDLRKVYTGPESFAIIDREMYIYYPDSVGRSKLANTLLEKKLQTSGTARNWNTVLQLRKMLQG